MIFFFKNDHYNKNNISLLEIALQLPMSNSHTYT